MFVYNISRVVHTRVVTIDDCPLLGGRVRLEEPRRRRRAARTNSSGENFRGRRSGRAGFQAVRTARDVPRGRVETMDSAIYIIVSRRPRLDAVPMFSKGVDPYGRGHAAAAGDLAAALAAVARP